MQAEGKKLTILPLLYEGCMKRELEQRREGLKVGHTKSLHISHANFVFWDFNSIDGCYYQGRGDEEC